MKGCAASCRYRLLGHLEACGCAKQQNPGHSTTDRSFRQGNVRRRKAHPDKRQQQTVGDEANNCSKSLARSDGPNSRCHDQNCQEDLECQNKGHSRNEPRRAARPMSWATVPLANKTSSQTMTSFRASSGPCARGNKPRTTKPRPRLSALVSACRRVKASGNRSSPTVPARKKKAPLEIAAIVKMSSR